MKFIFCELRSCGLFCGEGESAAQVRRLHGELRGGGFRGCKHGSTKLTEVHAALVRGGIVVVDLRGGRGGFGWASTMPWWGFWGLGYSTVDGSALGGRISWCGVELIEIVGHVAEGWG